MKKVIFLIFLIAYSYQAITDVLTNIDYENTEPYVEFDWLDDDKKSLTLEFTADVSTTIACALYNGSKLCDTTCTVNSRVVTCEFEGNNCKADGDNPATKYYHSVICGQSTSELEESALASVVADSSDTTHNPYITVAVKSGNYIKYSMILLLSLLVL